MALENADGGGAPSNPGGRKRDDFADFPRDGHGRPKIIRAELNPDTGRWEVPRDAEGNLIKELVPFTRSSTLGGAIEYQGGLHRWKSAVVAWGIARSRTLGKRARAVASYSKREDKDELYEIVDKAQAFAESDQAANHGTALHSVFRRIAEGETVEELVASGAIDDEDVYACQAFADAITRFVVVFAERRVVCDEAQTAGKYDIIVTPRRPMPVTDKTGKVVAVIMPGDMIAVDNKTSSSADYFGEKFTVQLWTYAHGRDYDPETGERTEVGVRKDWALILHIPSGAEEGTVATWHWVDLSIGEHLVKVARSVLEGRKLGKAAITVADLDAEIPESMLVQAAADQDQWRVEQGQEPGPPISVYAEPPAGLAGSAVERMGQLSAVVNQLAGRDPEDVIAGNDPRDAELIEVLAAEPVQVCRCVEPTCDECLHIPGCVDADDPVAWCDCEKGQTCSGPCRQRAHFPAKCPGSGKTYAPPALTKAVESIPELAAPPATPSLGAGLQAAAARNAGMTDWERARAYLLRKIGSARTPEELADLWKRGRKEIGGRKVWDRPDPEADQLAAARKAELLAELAPAG